MSVFWKRALASRTLIDYSNRESRESIGKLRLANMDLQRELSDARIALAVARGEDVGRATLDELDRVMARARTESASS